MQMRQRGVAALDANTARRWRLKLKMMLCVMMLPLVVVGCTSKQSSQSMREYTAPAWIMQLCKLTRCWAVLLSQEEVITMQKQLEGTQKYINEQCR